MDDLLKTIKKTLFIPIHPAGLPFIGIFAVVGFIMGMISSDLGIIGLILTLWCVFFFRNPIRQTPVREGLIISPADGTVQMITEVELPPELDDCKAKNGEKSFKENFSRTVRVRLKVVSVPFACPLRDLLIRRHLVSSTRRGAHAVTCSSLMEERGAVAVACPLG